MDNVTRLRGVALFRTRPVAPEVKASCTPTAATTTALDALSTMYSGSANRDRAMRLPTIARGRDLLCETVASAAIRPYSTAWNGRELVETPLPPDPWMLRPNPRTTLAHSLAWTVDNMLFYGFSVWWVLSRRALDGRPAGFVTLDSAQVAISAKDGTYANGVPVGDFEVSYGGRLLPRRDVVVFWSPLQGILSAGARAILVAERLDSAALRFANTPTAFGWLETSGEPMTAEELQDLAASWVASRELGSVGALSDSVTYKESAMDPSKMQLVEARTAMATDLARVVGVNAYLVSAPTGSGMVYSNAVEARRQLWADAHPYLAVIEQTLSNEEVTPRGTVVRLEHEPDADTDTGPATNSENSNP